MSGRIINQPNEADNKHTPIPFEVADVTELGSRNKLDVVTIPTFDFYPNPTNGIINIKMTSVLSDTSLKIIDAQGRLVEVKNVKSNTSEMIVDLAQYDNGLYTMYIQIGEKTFMKRIALLK